MNLFQTLYDLIVQYIFGGQGLTEAGILADQMQHLVATLVATIGWLFVMVVPFIVVWWLIKVCCTFFGSW